MKNDFAELTPQIKEMAASALFQYLPVTFYWLDINGIMQGGN
jgi:hypothetical protein